MPPCDFIIRDPEERCEAGDNIGGLYGYEIVEAVHFKAISLTGSFHAAHHDCGGIVEQLLNGTKIVRVNAVEGALRWFPNAALFLLPREEVRDARRRMEELLCAARNTTRAGSHLGPPALELPRLANLKQSGLTRPVPPLTYLPRKPNG